MTTKLLLGGAFIFAGWRLLAGSRTANSLQVTFADVAFNFQTIVPILKVKLRVTNPTNNPLTISGITGTVTIGNVIKGTAAYAGTTVFSPGNTDVWVPINLDPGSFLQIFNIQTPVKLALDLLVTTPVLQIPIQNTTTLL